MQRDRSFWIGVTAGLIVQQLVTALIVRKVAYRPARDTTAAIRSRRSTTMRTYRQLKALSVPELSEEFKKLRPDLWKPSMTKMDEGDLIELIQDAESEDESKSPPETPKTESRRRPTTTHRVKVETEADGTEVIEVETAPAGKKSAPKAEKRDLTISEMAEQIRKNRAQQKEQN